MKRTNIQFSEKECIVIFWEGHRESVPLLGGKFRHCAIVVKGRKYWVFLDPHRNGLEVGKIPLVPAADIVKTQIFLGRFTLRGVTFNANVVRKVKKIDCVKFCKYVLGIKTNLIHDPLSLYLFLRLIGFKSE